MIFRARGGQRGHRPERKNERARAEFRVSPFKGNLRRSEVEGKPGQWVSWNPKRVNKDRKIIKVSLMCLSGVVSMQQWGAPARRAEGRLKSAFKTLAVRGAVVEAGRRGQRLGTCWEAGVGKLVTTVHQEVFPFLLHYLLLTPI